MVIFYGNSGSMMSSPYLFFKAVWSKRTAKDLLRAKIGPWK